VEVVLVVWAHNGSIVGVTTPAYGELISSGPLSFRYILEEENCIQKMNDMVWSMAKSYYKVGLFYNNGYNVHQADTVHTPPRSVFIKHAYLPPNIDLNTYLADNVDVSCFRLGPSTDYEYLFAGKFEYLGVKPTYSVCDTTKVTTCECTVCACHRQFSYHPTGVWGEPEDKDEGMEYYLAKLQENC